MYRSLSITLVACLAIGGWAWSLQANADGTYLAVSPGAESPSPHDGVYVYDVAHGTWSRIWRHTVDLEWLPDNTRMVVSGRRGRPMRFTLLTRLGAARALPTLPRMGIEWAVMPDGSGLVATCRRAQGVGIEVQRLDFGAPAWRRVATYPHFNEDTGTGDHIALRKRGHDWMLSCHERGPADCRSLWVNLTTGAYTLGDEGDLMFDYSPNGRLVISEDGRGNDLLSTARSWPTQKGHVTAHLVKILPVMASAGRAWAEDSRHFVSSGQYPKDWKREIYTVFTADGTRVGGGVLDANDTRVGDGWGRVDAWVGPCRLLVETDAAVTLRPAFDADRTTIPVVTMKWPWGK